MSPFSGNLLDTLRRIKTGMIDFAEIMRERLRTGLITSRKERDDISAAVYRSLIAVLDNASSVPVDLSGPAMQTQGTADVPRTVLDNEDVTELLRKEHEERVTAAKEYRSYGREQEAADLEAQAIVIERILEEWKKEVL
jgi:uncharacterized protein YqeY